MIGSAMTQFVLLWWITDATGSISALATAGMFALLPQALLGPLGGTLADRYSRRLIMIVADVISALCMSVLIWLFLTNAIELWHLYTMMAIRSSMQAFQGPAASASIAMLVPRSFLPRAAGLNQTMIGIMTVAAAPLGALAISLMPIGWALSIDVFTALLGVVPLLLFSIPQLFVAKQDRVGLWREFREGLALVWDNGGLRRLYALVTATVLVIMPSFTLVPLLVREHFSGGAPQVALLEAIGGMAMIAGGVLITVLAPKRLILWVILGFGVSSLTLAFVALAPADQFWLGIAWWGVSSIAFIMGNAPLMTLMQTIVPNHLQGRALSLLSTVIALSAPIGLAIVTPLGELIGVRWLFVGMGLLSGVICLLGLFSRAIRNLGTPTDG
ncbi:MFS transporter [Aureimonas mangrovi]|uniref:MFS transporter n=1 Tax=Aureimonas mangrovi TaxID=2758041 RepID=UPI001AED6BB6